MDDDELDLQFRSNFPMSFGSNKQQKDFVSSGLVFQKTKRREKEDKEEEKKREKEEREQEKQREKERKREKKEKEEAEKEQLRKEREKEETAEREKREKEEREELERLEQREKEEESQRKQREKLEKERQSGFIGPPRRIKNQNDDEDEDSDDDDEEEEEEEDIPISHEVQLSGHAKAISALALDPSGARLLSGSLDYQVKFWDFAGMDINFRSFRSIEPCEGHQITALDYTATGDGFLVAPGSAQAKIYNRDGFQICEFVKGDQYLSDMNNTKGHVSTITDAMWDPSNRDIFLSSSLDSTVRLWDSNDDKKNKNVIKHRNARGGRVAVTTAKFSPDGKLILSGCQDGSIQIWKAAGPYANQKS